MSKEEAISKIVLDYLNEKMISHSAFARKCDISKAYLSKIVNKKCGKGISLTYLTMIANGMNMNSLELQELIENYQSKDTPTDRTTIKKEMLIKDILEVLKRHNEKDVELIHNIVLKSNHEHLETICNLLKSLK